MTEAIWRKIQLNTFLLYKKKPQETLEIPAPAWTSFCPLPSCREWPPSCTPAYAVTRPWFRCCSTPGPTSTARSALTRRRQPVAASHWFHCLFFVFWFCSACSLTCVMCFSDNHEPTLCRSSSPPVSLSSSSRLLWACYLSSWQLRAWHAQISNKDHFHSKNIVGVPLWDRINNPLTVT